MRVLIDTNVLVSYLLNPQNDGPVSTILSAVFHGRFILLVPDHLIDEFTTTVRNKARLANRITLKDLERLTEALRILGEKVPKINEPIPPVSRDLKDDYLVAYALVGNADYLVTGDKDLLALQGLVAGLEILTPAQFVEILGGHDLRQ